MKQIQFELMKNSLNSANNANSGIVEPQQEKVQSMEQKYQTIITGQLSGGEEITPGTLHWGGVEWRCGNCGATVTAPHGVTPDPDSGCPYGRHAWYKL